MVLAPAGFCTILAHKPGIYGAITRGLTHTGRTTPAIPITIRSAIVRIARGQPSITIVVEVSTAPRSATRNDEEERQERRISREKYTITEQKTQRIKSVSLVYRVNGMQAGRAALVWLGWGLAPPLAPAGQFTPITQPNRANHPRHAND